MTLVSRHRSMWRAGRGLLSILSLLAALAPRPAHGESDFAALRQRMVDEIAAVARNAGAESGRPTISSEVMTALARVPRHAFVPADQQRAAYENRPLPIGYGQTISQPYIVALMTDLMRVEAGHVVLEVGTGSGYQAAVLAELAQRVCTIEIVEALAVEAQRRLQQQGYGRVRTRVGDGYYGWEDCGPFDAIIVTAAANHVPPALIRQLKTGGRMVIPVGAAFLTQHLLLIQKNLDATIATRQILPVRFVPLTGGH
jgi:protein-L-isoaspartate(D-aspartate) O-methyltransferase